MSRRHLTPLNLRLSRLTTVPGEASAGRDVVLNMLRNEQAGVNTAGDNPLLDKLHQATLKGQSALRPTPRPFPTHGLHETFLSSLKEAALAKDATRALQLLDAMQAVGYPPHQGAYACAIRYAAMLLL